MKKLFTIDDIMVTFISSLGYGFGAAIAKLSGWSELASGLASFLLGLALTALINRIAFSKTVQKSPRNRIITYTVCFLIFLAAHAFSLVWMHTSMLDYLGEEFINAVGFPILGFVVGLLIRWFHIWQIRRLYGDGSQGYIFQVDEKTIAEMNRQNQPIAGKYDAGLAVKTRTGIYVGESYKKTRVYLGIPYAKPPVGDLRWKAPEPLPSSGAVFEAKGFGASAVQVEHGGSILKHHRQSEDCLTLNVCVGEKETDALKPVLVLFPNGDFASGGSADPLLYGSGIMQNDPGIVFVSFNHRLGIFGFIDFSEVPGGEAYPDTLNLGLADQAAALTWVRENIAAFGGDPERITALGFDSGAASILMLAASGQGKGLFQKAFLFNGSPLSVYETPEGARTLARDLLKETGTHTMAELAALPTETLKEAAQKLWRDMCAPVCDGKTFPTDLYRACQEGAASGIEFIVGLPRHQAQVFRSTVGEKNYEDFLAAAVDGIKAGLEPSLASTIQEYIEKKTASSSALEAKTALVDQWNALHIYRLAVKLDKGGNNVRLMLWNEKALIGNLGSGTVDAAATLLGNGDALQMYGSMMDKDLSVTLQRLMTKFIQGEDPQLYPNEIRGVSAIEWKTFPQSLIVSDGKIQCEPIYALLTEVPGLLDAMVY